MEFDIKPQNIKVQFSTEAELSVGFSEKLVAQTPPPVGETYAGPYEVKPKFDDQTLPTKEKIMADDVTVNAIEVKRVSNPGGGTTIYIGGLING